MSGSNSILSRPLNIYSLPQELLSNLAVRSIQATTTTTDPEQQPVAASSTSAATQTNHAVVSSSTTNGTGGGGGGLSCQTCPGASFDTIEEQREHFKSDWHRYNAKARLSAKGSVGLEAWEGMVEGISSLSGSASSSSSDDSSASNSKVTRLLARQRLSRPASEDSDQEAEAADRSRRAQLRTAVVWFTPTRAIDSLGVPIDTQFGVHRALFPPFDRADAYLDALRNMQLDIPNNGREQQDEDDDEDENGERRITMLMVAGGHFAGMVVALRPRSKTEKQQVKGAGDVRVLKSKTFHRYTTRKKQGGSQGLNDNAKSKAISAGAMLRRYGEQALMEEIRALLAEWADDLALSERIFLRASTHGKKSFWGYDGAVLEKTDERIRTFPFPTRRPTVQELLRCWHELTRVKVSHLSEQALQALDDAYIASLQPRKPFPKQSTTTTTATATIPMPETPKLTPEEEARLDRQRRMTDMIRKGRLDALKPFYDKYSTEFDHSILYIASSSGQEDILRWMLEDLRLDPTFISPEEGSGKRAYDVASTKGARNVFRRIAHDHPDWFDWKDGAHVPSGLSEEMEAVQEKKRLERRKGLKEKMKEREKERAKLEAQGDPTAGQEVIVQEQVKGQQEANTGGSQKLGGRIGGEGGLAGMTPEMRMKIERERRARAAEARLRG
ncbi:hypothetical protein BCR39DRAFT_595761 [Naematelia encephala]|uniref:VLRF1 domain-containing protein n=1 Tax=Naematelia encephala TaxID=71784 RepID=A0A1Y2AIT9_9TREE|nr:hypothetical protein BCR39DRAFT_595761 [Naematelia encephala]